MPAVHFCLKYPITTDSRANPSVVTAIANTNCPLWQFRCGLLDWYSMNKCKVLIVDDDPMTSRLFAVVLEKMGDCEVQEENRSDSALRSARSFRPNVILLDVRMPGKDGYQLSAEFGRDPDLSATPVVFITGSIAAFEGGFKNGQQYLAKPVDVRTLLDTVANLFSKQDFVHSAS